MAQSVDFKVRLFVGTDMLPPTMPVLTSVVPISPYQIDVAWGAVTDDVYVQGYRVYRNGGLLATTTLTSFVDIGLTPSTTYEYTIDAFDSSFNISSTSVSVATTTPALPPPVATSTVAAAPTLPQATTVPTLRSFHIKPQQTAGVVTFSSYGPTRYTLRFGQTTEYELGTISNNIFTTTHTSRLSGLEPGTQYFIELTLTNAFGISRVVSTESFTTEPALVSSLPRSVTGVRGIVSEADVRLSWTNPDDEYRAIRVVRSHLFYPQSATDGVVVYEGKADDFTDANALALQNSYYYSIFVMAADGRVSAPAVVWVKLPDTRLNSAVDVAETGGVRESNNSTGNADVRSTPHIPQSDTGLPQYLMPSDVFVTYGDTTVTLDSLTPLPIATDVLVSVPFAAVPRHLKTILLSVYYPTNHAEITTYLLKLRGDGTAYEVSFQSSDIEGEGKLIIEVFDYEHESVRRLIRRVAYVGTDDNQLADIVGTVKEVPWTPILGPIVLSGSLWWFFVFWRRRREDNP